MRYASIIVVILCCSYPLLAQEEVEVSVLPPPSYNSLRSKYIQTFPDHFFLWPVLKQRTLDFEMRSIKNKNKSLTYKSNKPYSFGLGMYVFELGIEFAFALPIKEQSKKIYGESDASDLQLNVIGKKWGIDAFVQKYDGFYVIDPAVEIPSNTPYPQRSDIKTRNIGVGANYTFNNQKFSFRSAYTFADRQLKNAGSFLLFGTLSAFKASGDSALLPDTYALQFGNESRIKEVKVAALAIAPGYTYSIIYKGFFLNGTLAVGPAHNWLAYTLEDGGTKNDIKFNTYVDARIGIGYNGDRLFGGLIFRSQNHAAKFDYIELVSSNAAFKMLVGYRFREVGILKKKILDFPKEILNSFSSR